MSFKALQWAAIVILPIGGPAAKATLCALAWHLNHETGLCNPSIETLAMEIGASENTVRAALAALEQMGVITIERRTNRTHHFRLHIGWGIAAVTNGRRGSKTEPQMPPRGVQSTNPKTAAVGVQNLNRRGSKFEPESWKEPGKVVAPTAPVRERRAARRTAPDPESQKTSLIVARERDLGGSLPHGSPGEEHEAQQERPRRTAADLLLALVADVQRAARRVH